MDTLGLVWNSKEGRISISEQRITNILTFIEDIITNDFHILARKFASLTGKIISTNAVIENISRLMTQHCSMSVASAAFWDLNFQLDQYCINEILFWHKNLKTANINSIDTMSANSNYMVYSDASGSGCGAHFNFNGEQVCHKLWDQHDITQKFYLERVISYRVCSQYYNRKIDRFFSVLEPGMYCHRLLCSESSR